MIAGDPSGIRWAAGITSFTLCGAFQNNETDDVAGAIAAYKRAMELDPLAPDIPAELALGTIESVHVHGVLRASQAVKDALGDRIR